MKEIYTFEGQSYEVDPSRLEEFMAQFPNATKVDEPGKTIDPASSSMDSGSESGLLEYNVLDKNISISKEEIDDIVSQAEAPPITKTK